MKRAVLVVIDAEAESCGNCQWKGPTLAYWQRPEEVKRWCQLFDEAIGEAARDSPTQRTALCKAFEVKGATT